MLIYYVYAYIRKDGTPYYIGKGKGNRAFDKDHTVKPPKDKSKIIFLETNLSNVGALALERRYIRWYGRKCNNSGILRNITEGGDGGSGSHRKGKTLPLESRRKMSEMKKGKGIGKDNPNYGNAWPEERKKALSELRKSNGKSTGKNNPMYGVKRPDLVERNKSGIGKHWYTDGINSKQYFPNEAPEGWRKGRIIYKG